MSNHDIPKQIIGLSRLAQLEWEIRQADSEEALDFIAVNDLHRVVTFDHACVWRERGNKITAVSGGLNLDATAPQIVFFAQLAAHMDAKTQSIDPVPIDPETIPRKLAEDFYDYIAAEAIWVPLRLANGYRNGGIIALRQTPFSESEDRVLSRLVNALAFAAVAIGAPIRRPWSWRRSGTIKAVTVAAVLLAVALIPVRMTTLSDAKVVAIDPLLVTAPLDGVVDTIDVLPNQLVKQGQLLLRYDATELRANYEIAAKRVAVLSADSRKTEQQAFLDPKARGDIGLLRARLSEGRAELAYARERLSRVNVMAPSSGLVLSDDPNTWIGRPVKVGERIMSVADPKKAKLQIHIPVDDALVVEAGARVDFFLAIAPAHPVRARLTKVSYDSKQLPNQVTAFVAEAEFDIPENTPRLGLTGTAKVFGERTPLYYALLRKPLSAIRRFIGM